MVEDEPTIRSGTCFASKREGGLDLRGSRRKNIKRGLNNHEEHGLVRFKATDTETKRFMEQYFRRSKLSKNFSHRNHRITLDEMIQIPRSKEVESSRPKHNMSDEHNFTKRQFLFKENHASPEQGFYRREIKFTSSLETPRKKCSTKYRRKGKNKKETNITHLLSSIGEKSDEELTTDDIVKFMDRDLLRLSGQYSKNITKNLNAEQREGQLPCNLGEDVTNISRSLSPACAKDEIQALSILLTKTRKTEKHKSSLWEDFDDASIIEEIACLEAIEDSLTSQMSGIEDSFPLSASRI